MVTQIINNDPTAVKAIRVERSLGLTEALPVLKVGEVLRFTVRQNQGNGQGLIFLNGQLIQAALPPALAAGSRILAKLAEVDSQVVFRILDQQHPLAPLPGGPAAALAQQLESIIRQAGPAGLQPPRAFPFGENLRNLIQLSPELTALFSSLSTAQLTDAETLISRLALAGQGELAPALREAAKAVRRMLDTIADPATQRFLSALNAELEKLLTNQNSEQSVKNQLGHLIAVLTRELKEGKADERPRGLLESVLKDLRNARSSPEELKQFLENATHRIEMSGVALRGDPSDGDGMLAARLQQTATSLEQMAATQETLRQLNPLMQSLGEPALILFPFLFQGLISHTEVTIDPKGGRKQGGKHGKDDDGGEDRSEGSRESYQRIQVSVPLPSLGQIDVDIAHRDKEILVRLTTPDSAKAEFLLEQLEHLAALLREQGFERAELVANVGTHRDISPSWVVGLHASTSIFA